MIWMKYRKEKVYWYDSGKFVSRGMYSGKNF